MPTRVADSGIGRALRKARQHRRLTLEEASRGTRLRAEYLDALEREAFDHLPGDVYIRSFLRSYGRFLGLNPGKVVAAYERAYGGRRPAPAPVDQAPAVAAAGDDALPDTSRHFPWPLAATVAVIALIAAGGIGLLSRASWTPEPAVVSAPPNLPVLPPQVQVDLEALQDVDVRVVGDGVEQFSGELVEGEVRSFTAEKEIDLWLASGASVKLVVNGTRVGAPGTPTEPYRVSFDRGDYREGPSADG